MYHIFHQIKLKQCDSTALLQISLHYSGQYLEHMQLLVGAKFPTSLFLPGSNFPVYFPSFCLKSLLLISPLVGADQDLPKGFQSWQACSLPSPSELFQHSNRVFSFPLQELVHISSAPTIIVTIQGLASKLPNSDNSWNSAFTSRLGSHETETVILGAQIFPVTIVFCLLQSNIQLTKTELSSLYRIVYIFYISVLCA